jgi:hypothetical protein
VETALIRQHRGSDLDVVHLVAQPACLRHERLVRYAPPFNRELHRKNDKGHDEDNGDARK